MVFALDAAIPAIGLDSANHHLDSEHHPYLLRLASARTWTTVCRPRLDHAAGIRIGSSGRCDSRPTATLPAAAQKSGAQQLEVYNLLPFEQGA